MIETKVAEELIRVTMVLVIQVAGQRGRSKMFEFFSRRSIDCVVFEFKWRFEKAVSFGPRVSTHGYWL